jgi:glucuronoarabinoxylan endo-1,4-beta-xylanase
MTKKNLLLPFLLLILITGFGEVRGQDITITTDSTFQTIRGFGGAFIEFWQPDLTADHVQTAFGTGEGEIGLTILRLGINPDSTQWSENLEAAQKAQEMGMTIFASPWHTPGEMREDIEGGEYRLRHDMYAEYAEHINNFAKYMKRNGVELYGVSVQNEPDIGEWTQWTPEEMLTFVRDYGHLIDAAKLLAPESFQFNWDYSDPILNDSLAAANTDVIVGHIYGGGNVFYPLAKEKGKEVWMTEYLLNEHTDGLGAEDWESATEEQKWKQSLLMAYTVHKSMESNMHAYIWWYLKRYYSFLDDGTYRGVNGSVTKRGFAFSHYSKYVRPGYVRINSEGPFVRGYTGVHSTAYQDPTTGEIIIVSLNRETSDKPVDYVINGMNSGTFTPVVSTLDETVEPMDEIAVTGSTFSYTLPRESIITFVSNGLSVSNEDEGSVLPDQIRLDQNYPNPFNPSTTIGFELPASGEVTLKVFDILGREVATLLNGTINSGYHEVNFDATGLSSGVYLYELTTADQSITQKMLLLK